MIKDKIKLTLSVLLILVGIAGFYYFEEDALIYRLLIVLLGIVLGAALFLTTVPGKTFYAYVGDSVQEAKRVVWPTRKETIQTTFAISVVVVVVAIFLWVIDSGFLWLVRALMGRSS